MDLSSIKSTFENYLFPKSIGKENWTFEEAMSVRHRQRNIKIAQIALYVLTTVLTTVTLASIEAAIVPLPIFFPLLITTLACWALLITLKHVEKKYEAGLDDKVKAKLAQEEMQRLLLKEPIKSFKDDKDIQKGLKRINTLLEMEAIDINYLSKFEGLEWDGNAEANSKRNLFEIIQEHNKGHPNNQIDLTLKSQKPQYKSQVFGSSEIERLVLIDWNGAQDGLITVQCFSGENCKEPCNARGIDRYQVKK